MLTTITAVDQTEFREIFAFEGERDDLTQIGHGFVEVGALRDGMQLRTLGDETSFVTGPDERLDGALNTASLAP